MLLVIDSSQRPTAGGVAMPEKARSYLVLMELLINTTYLHRNMMNWGPKSFIHK